MRSALVGVLTLAAGLVGCAPDLQDRASSQAAGPKCFQASSLLNFKIVDDRIIDLELDNGDVYRADLYGSCVGLEGAMRIGLRGRGGAGWICQGAEAEILMPQSPVGPQSCPARNLQKLSKSSPGQPG
jgi:hypothetical protein